MGRVVGAWCAGVASTLRGQAGVRAWRASCACRQARGVGDGARSTGGTGCLRGAGVGRAQIAGQALHGPWRVLVRADAAVCADHGTTHIHRCTRGTQCARRLARTVHVRASRAVGTRRLSGLRLNGAGVTTSARETGVGRRVRARCTWHTRRHTWRQRRCAGWTRAAR